MVGRESPFAQGVVVTEPVGGVLWSPESLVGFPKTLDTRDLIAAKVLLDQSY
jgi:hypothetical protein